MARTYWRKQINSDPLFPDILWSRPQSKSGAGKLAVIGGNSHGFGAPGMAYGSALAAGVGVCKVLLPDAIRKVVRGMLPDADFAPSTPSGSFSKQALDSLLSSAAWADLVLLSGDLGRNSETAILLERFVQTYKGPLTTTQDAVDYFKETPLLLMDRPDTLVALSLSQLQKMFVNTPTITPVTLSMTTIQLVEALHEYTLEHRACIVVKHNELMLVAYNGYVASHQYSEKIWRVVVAAHASVFWLQNLDNIIEAATSSLITDKNDGATED